MRRIAIIGSGGAGKSTLARELGARLGLPVFHLDALFWRPGWTETPSDEWRTIQHALVARDTWIIDGNYGGTLDIRLAAADTVIFLDLPRLVCLRGALWRRVRYAGRSRPDIGDGCRERWSWDFMRWSWTYPATRRPAIEAKLAQYADGRRIVRLRDRAAVWRFVLSIEEQTSRDG